MTHQERLTKLNSLLQTNKDIRRKEKEELLLSMKEWAIRCFKKGISKEKIVARFLSRLEEKSDTFTKNEIIDLIRQFNSLV